MGGIGQPSEETAQMDGEVVGMRLHICTLTAELVPMSWQATGENKVRIYCRTFQLFRLLKR